MKKIVLAGFGLTFSLWSLTAQSALERVADFALLDSQGEFHQLSRYQHRKALVVMSYANACTDMANSLAAYKALSDRFSAQDIEFLLLDPLDQGRDKLAELQLGLPLLEDGGQLVSEALGVEYAGEVMVLNPQRLSLYYRGAVGEELVSTLNAVLEDSVSDTVTTAGNGCVIDYPMQALHAETPPDYGTEVAPILIENCTECHRQGGVGPFALDSYIMVLGWSPMIREVLLNKRMPPAQVDPYIGHSDDARYLTKQDLQTLVHWIDARAPRGDMEEDPLENLITVSQTFIASNSTAASESSSEGVLKLQWELGEPDYIVTGPSNAVPPTGVMDYVYNDVTLPFATDKWLRAIQYLPGDESVLHHLMTFVTAPGEDFWGPERDQLSVTRRFVEGYAPGKPGAVEFPAGTAVLIPAGHKLSMQFHYVTNGQSTIDVTKMGLYFSDEAPAAEKLTQAVSARFVVPANDPEFPLQASHRFDEPVVIFGVRARMNNRGKKMKFSVQYPNGTQQDLFSVPAYNYGWQPHYILDEAVSIPAGSTVLVTGALDNSISNPNNPDPDKDVGFGLNSWDEMFTGYFSYYPVSQ